MILYNFLQRTSFLSSIFLGQGDEHSGHWIHYQGKKVKYCFEKKIKIKLNSNRCWSDEIFFPNFNRFDSNIVSENSPNLQE